MRLCPRLGEILLETGWDCARNPGVGVRGIVLETGWDCARGGVFC